MREPSSPVPSLAMSTEVTPAQLVQAAGVIVTSILKLKVDERFVIVSDLEADPIANVLEAAGQSAGAQVAHLRLDLLRSVSTNHPGERPHKVLPDGVRRAMLAAQASIFVASAPHQELSMREQLLHIVGACHVRHVHMPGATRTAFALGAQVDYGKVASFGRGMERRLELARSIEASSAAGTRLTIAMASDSRWVSQLGDVAAGQSIVFPAGSLFASPESATGVFVANASLGEFFGLREGPLLLKPVTFHVAGGRVTRVLAPHSAQLQKEIETMIGAAPNSERVGLVTVGVNVGVDEPTGDASVDQNLLGLHLTIGDPLPKMTGASWNARTSFLACQVGATVTVDGRTVINGGKIAGAG